MMTKGILLAGGSGTRLHPMTLAASKQLLPVYDKPMVYYPLSVLMLAGIQRYPGHFDARRPAPIPAPPGRRHPVRHAKISYRRAAESRRAGPGLRASAATGWEISPCALALGDNLIFGEHLIDVSLRATRSSRPEGATVFAYQVRDPERYGVVTMDVTRGSAIDLVEKPAAPESNWAVIGLYFYDSRVGQPACGLEVKPSPRGELEITDLNRLYMEEGTLHVERLGRGCAWLDAGTPGQPPPSCDVRANDPVTPGNAGRLSRRGRVSERLDRRADLLRAARESHLGKTELGRVLAELAEGEHE